jgi:hypothetical protein
MTALLAAGLGAVAGGIGSKEAKKARKRAERNLESARNRSSLFKDLERRDLERALEELLKNFDTARSDLGRAGEISKRDVRDNEVKTKGVIDQRLLDAGLTNTTVGANADRGLAADTQRRLSEIDVGIASLFSDLAVQRAGAETSVRGAIARSTGARGALASDFANKQLLLDTTSFQAPPLDFSGIAQGLLDRFGGPKPKKKSTSPLATSLHPSLVPRPIGPSRQGPPLSFKL